MLTSLLRCYDCNRLLSLGLHNRAPSCPTRPDYSSYFKAPWDDEESFRRLHAGHRLGEMRIVPGTLVGEGSWSDPMRVIYFEAIGGSETIVVRRHRTGLDRPAMYDVVPGRLVIRPVALEVQWRDLIRQLDFELGDELPADSIHRFVEAVEGVTEGVDLEDLEEVSTDPRDARLAYVRLGEEHRAEILDRLRDHVPAETLRRLQRFMTENLEGNDVMNLLLRKAFSIEEEAAGEPRASTPESHPS